MKKITESELEVMKILWKFGKCNSLEIIEELEKCTNWNKNTIRTLITRLVEKDAIKIVGQVGKTYIYETNISKEDYQKKESNNFLQKIFNGSINGMLLQFVKQDKLKKEDLQELLDFIEREE